MQEIRVRFAPSPTGALHLGGARTALFNWLWARHTDGKFLLRIEDTDKERSTEESILAIIDALKWLGISWDEEPVFQSSRLDKHKSALDKLKADGRVYKCYCTPEERNEMRRLVIEEKRFSHFNCRCDEASEISSKPFVWRFRMPRDGETIVDDVVQGRVITPNQELEDLAVARSDGSPLYNFAVVVDDSAMGVTHVIRGKDHLTNTPKQIQIYKALGLTIPVFAHLPLILGLSKRLRSLGIESYRSQGYLPEAIVNYIARLGWSHGDQEIFAHDELIRKFDLGDVNRSEGALSMEKMEWLNQQYIQSSEPGRLAQMVHPFLATHGMDVAIDNQRLAPGCDTLKARAKTLVELAQKMRIYLTPDNEIEFDAAAVEKHLKPEARTRLGEMSAFLASVEVWSLEEIEAKVRAFCESQGVKLKNVAQPARVALTGLPAGPGLFELMHVLGQESTVNRLNMSAT